MLLHAVLMTYSRGAMVALLVATPVIFLRGRNKFQLFLAAVAIAAVVPILAGPEIRARFFTINTYEDESSARLRFASWDAAYRMSLDYPIFGVGVRNANLFSPSTAPTWRAARFTASSFRCSPTTAIPDCCSTSRPSSRRRCRLRRVRRWSRDRDDEDGRIAYAVACGIEGGLAVFCVGSLFLSLEVFELPYVLLLLGAQLPLVLEAQGLMGVGADGRAAAARPGAGAAVQRGPAPAPDSS